LSLGLRKSKLDINLKSIDFLIMEIIYSIHCAFWTVISIAFSFIANECKWLLNSILPCPLLYMCRFDITITRENITEFPFSPFSVEVLYIDVIDNIRNLSGISGIKFNKLTNPRNYTFLNSLLDNFWIFEAYKPISIWDWRRKYISFLDILSIFIYYYLRCWVWNFGAFYFSN
jgi:hypothetical protein